MNAISAADIAFIMSSSQAIVKLIECSRPIRFFIVSLVYNNNYNNNNDDNNDNDNSNNNENENDNDNDNTNNDNDDNNVDHRGSRSFYSLCCVLYV